MIFRNLMQRSTRNSLTCLGIAISVAAVIALGTIAKELSPDAILTENTDLLVTQAGAIDPGLSSLDETIGARLQALPGVNYVEKIVYRWIMTEELPLFRVFGYEIFSTKMAHYRIVEGKAISKPGQIILGRQASEMFAIYLGDNLRISGTPYRVVGIYETGQSMEDAGGVLALEDAQTVAQFKREVSFFEIALHQDADIDAVTERIESLDLNLLISTTNDQKTEQRFSQFVQGVARGIAALAILIGSLGVMNAMIMSVRERTREIGTLSALGWSRWRIVWMILGESVTLSGAGGIVGIFLGAGLVKLAGAVTGMAILLSGVSLFTAAMFTQGMLTAMVLGLVGGVYPAWRAAGLRPVEALSYEGGAGAASDSKEALSRVGGQSFRNLWRRRDRTLLAAAGIGIGIAMPVMLGGLTAGMIRQVNGLAGSGSLGNITVMQRDVPNLLTSHIDERLARQIQAMPQVESVSPMVMGVMLTPELPMFAIQGLDPNGAAMDHYKLTAGQWGRRPNEIVIGNKASESYDLNLGDTMTLYNSRYKVVGIYETGVAWEEVGGILALRESQRLLSSPRTVSFLFVNVKDPSLAEPVLNEINRRFPETRASISSKFAQNTNTIATMQAIARSVGMLALIIGGIVIANTMIMSIYERTREIGTLQALGWPGKRILTQIMQESLLLCLLAALLGCFGGVLLLNGMADVPFAGNFMLRPAWEPPTFVSAVALTLILGLLGGFYPAWRASRLQPVEALRYE